MVRTGVSTGTPSCDCCHGMVSSRFRVWEVLFNLNAGVLTDDDADGGRHYHRLRPGALALGASCRHFLYFQRIVCWRRWS